MKALKVFSMAVIFGFLVSVSSFADNLKIAYFDLSKVFDNYQKTKEFDSVLQGEGQSFQKQRDAMIAKIQDAQNETIGQITSIYIGPDGHVASKISRRLNDGGDHGSGK